MERARSDTRNNFLKLMKTLIAGLKNKNTTILGLLILVLSHLEADSFDFTEPKNYIGLLLAVALFLSRDAEKSTEKSQGR